MKIEIFQDESAYKLQKNTNEFLKNLSPDQIIDIKFEMSSKSSYGCDYSVIIIWCEKSYLREHRIDSLLDKKEK